jgi:hypothetical protein
MLNRDDFDVSDQDLPPTEFEREEARHRIVTEQNLKRDRIMRRRRNKEAGYPRAPMPGDKLYVSVERSLQRRSRAGLRFERGQPQAVEVVALSDEDVLKEQKAGKYVVNPYGADMIIEDTSLILARGPQAASDDVVERNAQLEEELQLARAELKKLRDARANAPESTDGKPSRLPAARAAAANPGDQTTRTQAGGQSPTSKAAVAADEDFGSRK